jgi:hypothetical protein
MKKKILLLVCLLIFIRSKSFSQNVIWDFKESIFVEKISDIYIMEWFHHKVEIDFDTLRLVNDSLYSGKSNTLIILNQELYLKSRGNNKMLKLKISTSEALKKRKVRKDYNIQFS